MAWIATARHPGDARVTFLTPAPCATFGEAVTATTERMGVDAREQFAAGRHRRASAIAEAAARLLRVAATEPGGVWVQVDWNNGGTEAGPEFIEYRIKADASRCQIDTPDSWEDICNRMNWDEETQILHLEAFIQLQGLGAELAAYAQEQAAFEEKEA